MSGYRSSIAVSLLRRHGFEDVVHLVGGFAARRARLAERERAWAGIPEASLERYRERVRGKMSESRTGAAAVSDSRAARAKPTVNGIDVEAMERFRALAATDASKADREPTAVARWVGGRASRIEIGLVTARIGGDDHPNSMQALLASLAACEVDVVALHAALIGIAIEELEVEVSGHFNVRAYLGLDRAPRPGYDRMACQVRLRAPDATPEQIAYLGERCRRSSPVGDSVARSIPLAVEVEAS